MDEKTRILKYCSDLFLKEGFYKISMDSISIGLRISKKTLYKHFKSKDELVSSVIGNITQNIKSGFAVIFVPHTTAGIIINEGADPSVQQDIIESLVKIFPDKGSYHHREGNSDAHIKSSLFGSSVNILIEDYRLILGTWQHLFFYEGDGPRRRRVYIKIISD